MLVPAIMYKEEIEKNFAKKFYSMDMFYETGTVNSNWSPDIPSCPEGGLFTQAIINSKEKVIGYLSYRVDYYESNVYNFGLISFDKGNALVGKDIFDKLEELVQKFHRVEWRAIGGNPACRGYDKFIKKHNGKKLILTDACKDADGNYHDDYIYEIINKEVK